VSLGGNMLVNYLAAYRHDPLVDAATVVSAPLDLASCSKRIEQGFSRVYCQYLLNSLKKNAREKKELLHQALGIRAEDIAHLNSLYAFDDMITAPLHGFADAADYYRQCSGIHVLDKVAVPLQVIHAKDDPFMTRRVIPDFRLPGNIHYRLFDHGGHVGFVSGSVVRPEFWLERALPDYYQHLQQHNANNRNRETSL
jgi:hypothetical protein